jgi:hypothetical protein
MPICTDSEGFKWIGGWVAGTAPVMGRNAFAWMLHGDVGEDNTTPLVMASDDAADPANWVESGPHLMMFPKDPKDLDAFPTDFSTGAPFAMFQGNTFAHLMIPTPGYYADPPPSSDEGAGSSADEEEEDDDEAVHVPNLIAEHLMAPPKAYKAPAMMAYVVGALILAVAAAAVVAIDRRKAVTLPVSRLV